MLQAKDIFGGNLELRYDVETKQPAITSFGEDYTRYIGCQIRDKAKMYFPSWNELDQERKDNISVAISAYFAVDPNDKLMCNWMEEHAKSRFREWKCELHKHYQKWKHLGRNGTPSKLLATMVKAGAEAIQTIAEERYPDLPPEECPVHEIQITDTISRALIMSKAVPRGKNKHYVRGTGRVGNGLLTRVFGTSLPTPKMSEEMQRQKADEAQRVKKNAEEAAKRIKKNEEHTTALEKTVSSMKSFIRLLVTKLSPDQCDSNLLASLPQDDDDNDEDDAMPSTEASALNGQLPMEVA